MLMRQRGSGNENEANEIRKLVKETVELTGKFNLSDYIWFCKNNSDLWDLEKGLRNFVMNLKP